MSHDSRKKRVVIKIGSSSLTSMHGEISRRKLERLVDEVARLKDDGHEVLLVSSGAVAAGYRKLGCLERPNSLPEKQAAAAIGQGLLIEAYSDLFLSHGYVASQILITRSDFSDENRYNNARNTINVLLERGIIPIVNENDTVTINRLKFGDNDTLSAKVSALVDADQLLILSDIDGLYNCDPRKNKNATLLDRVEEITSDIEDMAGEPGSAVGTGGMRSKIDAFKITMAAGIPAFLGKSGTPDIIYEAVHRKAKGTYFEAKKDATNLDSRQQWIAFNSGPEGEIIIKEPAKNRIKEQAGGVHLQDIEDIAGQFKKGAVVRILDSHKKQIALGIVNYTAQELVKETNSSRNNIEAVSIDHLVCHIKVSLPVGL
ncbi:glutamate 5-kinase [Bacillus sp. HMF5848]|uniref:glutamate 5-kinase n=1 Tax=Bacillus sp. HMF5848 TaxID=2495421 RepID=UPI000F781B6A|nr:glutamate 5-kinase [Bacillus sp. HMF5848]RSK27129.1 glutamate 5-kinase [Bacillus sp. HMF5848]